MEVKLRRANCPSETMNFFILGTKKIGRSNHAQYVNPGMQLHTGICIEME